MNNLFRDHIALRQKNASELLTKFSYDALIISSGGEQEYFADDYHAPFRATPHFAHWCPEASPFHLLIVEPGRKPRLVFFKPDDFWHEVTTISGDWLEEFDVEFEKDKAKVWSHVQGYKRGAYIGPQGELKSPGTLVANPEDLTKALDWYRCVKSEYEVECLKEANKIAAIGHKAVKAAFEKTLGDEFSLHLCFLEATKQLERELPYSTIIALGDRSATLHYQHKRRNVQGEVLLIDAGCKSKGYASDITRTYATKKAHPVFVEIVKQLEVIQQELCAMVKAGVLFVDLHRTCHARINEALLQVGVLKNVDATKALELGLSTYFLPHGLGHMLGLQVHDVGGRQLNWQGDLPLSHPEFPKLRMVRPLNRGEVITIEPGIYFIPLLLDPEKKGERASYFNWSLIEDLYACGGVRIEDDVLVGEYSSTNLTRTFLP